MKALSKLVLDPAVTLDYEAHGIPEEAQEAGFLDWLCSFVAVGDDGQKYWFGCSPLILDAEKTDMWHFEIGWETGEVVQSPTSIFKIANYPPVNITGQHVYPQGTLKIDRNEDFVKITVGENFQVVCKTDHTWHYTLKDEDRGIRAEFVHHGVGFPTWYGKERPSYLTQHSIAYGYNWSGLVEGTFWINDRKVEFKGKGIRERYIAVDSSAAEIGGWEDWGWFHFDEVFGSLYEMRLGNKDFSLNLSKEGLYFPTGDFKIEHQEWAFLPQLGTFIPTVYKVKIETEGGILNFTAQVVGASVWGVTGRAPSTPVATLNWGAVAGTFTYIDGREVVLTNGTGGMSVRQWEPYPNIFGAGILGTKAKDDLTHMSTL